MPGTKDMRGIGTALVGLGAGLKDHMNAQADAAKQERALLAQATLKAWEIEATYTLASLKSYEEGLRFNQQMQQQDVHHKDTMNLNQQKMGMEVNMNREKLGVEREKNAVDAYKVGNDAMAKHWENALKAGTTTKVSQTVNKGVMEEKEEKGVDIDKAQNFFNMMPVGSGGIGGGASFGPPGGGTAPVPGMASPGTLPAMSTPPARGGIGMGWNPPGSVQANAPGGGMPAQSAGVPQGTAQANAPEGRLMFAPEEKQPFEVVPNAILPPGATSGAEVIFDPRSSRYVLKQRDADGTDTAVFLSPGYKPYGPGRGLSPTGGAGMLSTDGKYKRQ